MIQAFYSDPHFGHANVIEYCGRPFENAQHQTEELIRRYNALIKPDEFVLWVGDCFVGTPKTTACAIMALLNGTKGLVIGNHDKSPTWMIDAGFTFVTHELQLRIGDRRVRVSHYPYADALRDRRYRDRCPMRIRGEVLIHGHSHSPRRRTDNMIHVGVDAWDYRPAPYDAVEKLMAEM